jgi:hypothetical protein
MKYDMEEECRPNESPNWWYFQCDLLLMAVLSPIMFCVYLCEWRPGDFWRDMRKAYRKSHALWIEKEPPLEFPQPYASRREAEEDINRLRCSDTITWTDFASVTARLMVSSFKDASHV